MSKYGPSLDGDFSTAEMSAPGAPALVTAPVQNSDTEAQIEVLIPNTTFDGSTPIVPTKVTLATALEPDGNNPLLGLSMEQAIELDGVSVVSLDLVPADAGAAKIIKFPVLRAGISQAYKVACLV